MTDAEPLYDALAQHLDAVGEARAAVFLAKAALALGHALNDTLAALDILRDCVADLDRSPEC